MKPTCKHDASAFEACKLQLRASSDRSFDTIQGDSKTLLCKRRADGFFQIRVQRVRIGEATRASKSILVGFSDTVLRRVKYRMQ